MWLIVGLGNPGKCYHLTRHNLGFRVVEKLGNQNNIHPVKVQESALCASGLLGGKKIMLAQPLTYINRSGQAVAGLACRYKLSPLEILVIHDDLDLELGVIRLRTKGGSGGHKGIISVIEELGTDQFNRLRIGIGRPPLGQDVVDHVLSYFSPEEEEVVSRALETAVEAVICFVKEGMETAMNRYN